MNPENLKPWPKGVSGNPKGTSKIPEDLRGIKSLTQLEVCKLISKYARSTKLELDDRKLDPTTPALELAIASIFLEAAKRGDFMRLGFLLDRAIGKVPISIDDDEAKDEREELQKLSMKELLTLVKTNLPEES